MEGTKPEMVEVEREQLETLITNVQSLKRQRKEMLQDIKSVVDNFVQLGEEFSDTKQIMALISKITKAMLMKDKQSQNLFTTLLGPTSDFVNKYAPIVYRESDPETPQING